MSTRSVFLSFLLLTTSLASTAHADHDGAIDAAVDVENALGELKDVALRSADRAASQGNEFMVQKRDGIADQAAFLSLDVHRRVHRPLLNERPLRHVRRNLRDLQDLFDDLDSDVHSNGVPFPVRNALRAVEDALEELEEELEEPTGNLAVTCAGKFGGNFFNKVTHVECTLTGRGATSFEVVFANQGRTVTAQGTLQPQQAQQSFVTSKVSIGTFANYTVFVVDRLGNRHQLAQGQATGNIF